jgi:hypothetical protein
MNAFLILQSLVAMYTLLLQQPHPAPFVITDATFDISPEDPLQRPKLLANLVALDFSFTDNYPAPITVQLFPVRPSAPKV